VFFWNSLLEFLIRFDVICFFQNFAQAEFIREAIRDKIKDIEKEEALKQLDRIYGMSKRKTTDKELHAAGEKAFFEIEKFFKENPRANRFELNPK